MKEPDFPPYPTLCKCGHTFGVHAFAEPHKCLSGTSPECPCTAFVPKGTTVILSA